jgi:lambda family phage portal protein
MTNPFTSFFEKVFAAPALARIEKDGYQAAASSYGFDTGPSWMSQGGMSGAKSPSGLSMSGMVRAYDHKRIRRNVRDAMYDSVQCRAMVQRFADLTAGTGLKLRFEPNARALGIPDEQASEWAEEQSERFHLWASSKDSDASGVNTFYQNQHMYAFMQQRDNDMFVRLHYRNDSQLISPLQIQFIDAEQVGGSAFTSTDGFQYGYDGIDRDPQGKEIGYHVMAWDGKKYNAVKVPAKSGRRTIMLHGYNPEYAGQGRGFSRFAHALAEFESITDFTSAHIIKAINQSQFGFYTKPSKDAPASNPLADFMATAGPRPSQVLGSNPDPAAVAEVAPTVGFRMLNEWTARQPGAAWVANLMSGEDLKTVDNSAPADNFDRFVDAFVTHLAASVSMPVEVLLMKFGENYSASRATLVLMWRVLSIWIAEMAADFLNPVVESWLAEEIASGRTSAPGWSDPRMRAAWMQCRWIGSAIPSIDPLKEAKSDAMRTEMGHLTLDDGSLSFNGSSGKANRAKLAREIPELSVPPWSTAWDDGKEESDGESRSSRP